MAIGRISGSVLKSNLTRNGTDLAFETNLLYLDVTNSRVGIGTSEPTATLHVNGNTNITGNLTGVTDVTASGTTQTDIIKNREQRYTTSNMMKFNQLYTGASSGSYFSANEYQKAVTITPSGDSQNYQVIGRITAQNAGETHVVNFNAALRSNTLPDLNWTILYDEEYNGSRYIDPQLWTKETTTAGFIFAFKTLGTIYGTVTVDFDVIPRNSSQLANVSINTTQDSEQTSIDSGFTANDMTRVVRKQSSNVNINGSVTATSFTGDGSNLTNVPATLGDLTAVGSTISSPSNADLTLDPSGSGNISVASNKIIDLAAPGADTDASTKKYVDDSIASVSTTSIAQLNTNVAVTDTGSNGTITVTADGNTELTINDTTAAFSGNVTVAGTTDLSGATTITANTTGDALLITTTEASSTAAPVITLKRNSSSPADADYLGQIKFKGENDADQEIVYAKMTGKILDASDGTEDGIIEIAHQKAGSNVITARLRSDSYQLLNGTTLTVDGQITGNLTGNVTGNVSGSSGSTTGNAATATALATARNIAGQSFDGTSAITIASTDLSNTSAIALLTASQTLTNKTLTAPVINSPTGDFIKIGGTNFTDSLLVGHSTTGTLNSAEANTGVGIGALDTITSADSVTAVGKGAGTNITSGGYSTAVGADALFTNSTGTNNTAIGRFSLRASTGSNNVALGKDSGEVLSSGSQNIIIGANSGDQYPTTGSGNVLIGSNIDTDASDSVRTLKIVGYDGTNTTTWISGDSSGNLTTVGDITLANDKKVIFGDAGENIVGDGTDLTINSSGDVIIKLTGEQLILHDGTSNIGQFDLTSNNLTVEVLGNDKDMLFKGWTGASQFTALTLDMSAAGFAEFNSKIRVEADSSANAILVKGRSADDIGTIKFSANDGSGNQGELSARSSVFIFNTPTQTNLRINNTDKLTLTSSQINLKDNVFVDVNEQIQFGDAGENIVGDGTNLTISSSGKTIIDSTGDIELDAASGVIDFIGNGTVFGNVAVATNDLVIKSRISDGDMSFRGNDGGAEVTALTLDMSAAGAATFNAGVTATTFSGSGASLTSLNGSNISSGTIAAARVATLNQDTSGNAATATALETARNIGGVSFDGSGNINLPGVNTSGNQNTSGNADTATTATNVTASANNSTSETVYLTFVDGATGTQGIETDTGLNYNPSTGVLTTTSVTGNLTGNVTGNVSGSSGSTTGNAATATALATARNIAGQSFDGTSAITIASTDLSNTSSITLNTSSQTLTNKTLTSPQINTQIDVLAQGQVRLQDTSGGQYVALRAPGTVTSNTILTLPDGAGTSGQVLSTNGSGTLSWADGGGGGSGSSYPNSTISTLPGSEGNYDLGKNAAQDTAETPFEAGGTDAFGVNLGTVFDMMDPIGTTESTDLGADEAYVGA